jgi:hypothetical protein
METVEKSLIEFGENCLKNGTRYRCGGCCLQLEHAAGSAMIKSMHPWVPDPHVSA